MIKVALIDPKTGSMAEISKRGKLTSGEAAFSEYYTAATATDNVAVNLITPKANYFFVITSIILAGDRSIAANGAITDIFENNIGPTDGTVVKQIYQDEIAKQTRAVITGLNIKVTPGHWVNVKSDDVIVRANVAGYYLPN